MNISAAYQLDYIGIRGELVEVECNLDWNVTLNTHKQLDIIYLDYAKAFDSVVHVKLLAKLSAMVSVIN